MARKSATRQTASEATSGRVFKQPVYKSFRLQARVRHPSPKLPGVFALLKQSALRMWTVRRTMLGILGIYALAQLVFVQGVLGGNVLDFADQLTEAYKDLSTGLLGVALFSYVVTTTGQANTESGAIYQFLFVVIVSLALIWTLRHVYARERVSARDAFYKGMTPLIPFILVITIVCIQLIPAIIGAWLYQVIITSGVAVTLMEQIFWAGVAGFFVLLTIYLLCASIFAIYIVTLPDGRPIRALRSAHGLVLHRRLAIFRRVAGFLTLLLLLGAVILIPAIFFIPAVATWIFYIMSVMALGAIHMYGYGLYRELLRDA